VPERALVAPLCSLEQLVLALRVSGRGSHHQVRRRSCSKVIALTTRSLSRSDFSRSTQRLADDEFRASLRS
jgi:hypothetical protein